MRLKTTFFLVMVSAVSHGQTWEKMIGPGLTYRMEADLATPRLIHALRYSLNSGTLAMPEVAAQKVYTEGASKGRETISQLVARTQAIAAINADFFPFTGDPLGLMVRAGELVSTPSPKRSAFGWGREEAMLGLADFTFKFRTGAGDQVRIDGLNQECGQNDLMLNTESAGVALATKGPAVHVVLKLDASKWGPSGKATAEVLYLVPDAPSIPIQSGHAILSASGPKSTFLRNLTPGEKLSIEWATTGFNWSKIEHAVSGGPTLLKNGQPAIDWSYQGFNASFANQRHPRTAVGRTAGGDLWFVAIDGRQTISAGATLAETASIMRQLGCVDAINLDGGGSTTLNILGMTVNRPSEGVERPLANAVLFFGPPPPALEENLVLRRPERVLDGDTVIVKVFGADGQQVPNSEVLWMAQGSAWIDQGGVLRTTGEGQARVNALVRGQLITDVLAVEPNPMKNRFDRVVPPASRGKTPPAKGGTASKQTNQKPPPKKKG